MKGINNKINISSVKIIKNEREQSNNLLAFVNFTINDCFIVTGARIIKLKDKMFVAMPSKRRSNQYIDVCHPLNQETRNLIENVILTEYANTEEK